MRVDAVSEEAAHHADGLERRDRQTLQLAAAVQRHVLATVRIGQTAKKRGRRGEEER
jgi:hypothetical protein